MGTSMEARKKAGPFMPRWQKVKGSHKALGGKLFQPDISGAINRYDQTLVDYDALLKEQQKLKAIIGTMMKANDEAAGERDKLNAELAQMTTKMQSSLASSGALLRKYADGGSADAGSVKSALDAVVSGGEDYINKRKQLFTDIDGVAYGNLGKVKKTRDEFASAAGAGESQTAKLESEASSAESSIMSILQGYIGIADDADHPEIVKSLKGLKV